MQQVTWRNRGKVMSPNNLAPICRPAAVPTATRAITALSLMKLALSGDPVLSILHREQVHPQALSLLGYLFL